MSTDERDSRQKAAADEIFEAEGVVPAGQSAPAMEPEAAQAGAAGGSPCESVAAVGSIDGRQQQALELLLSGKSVAAVAREIGLGRTTIFRWLRDDAAFRSAYNQWKEELKESGRGRLLALTDAAVTALEGALAKGDARAALVLLTRLGILSKQGRESIDPEEIGARLEIEEKRRKSRLATAQRKVELDDKWQRAIDADQEKTVNEWDKPRRNESVEWKGRGK